MRGESWAKSQLRMSIMFEIYQLQGLQRLIRLCRSTQSAQQITFWTHVYDIIMLYVYLGIYHDIQYIISKWKSSPSILLGRCHVDCSLIMVPAYRCERKPRDWLVSCTILVHCHQTNNTHTQATLQVDLSTSNTPAPYMHGISLPGQFVCVCKE